MVARELLRLRQWEARGVLDSVSPGDCQGSCRLQGIFTIDTAEDRSRFSSTFPLLIAHIMQNEQILSSLSVSIRGFFEKQKPCAASNQHFHGILFIVLISVQHCRLAGSRSLALSPFATLILHWHDLLLPLCHTP